MTLNDIHEDRSEADLFYARGCETYLVKAYFDSILDMEIDAISEEDALQKAKEDIEAKIEELFDKSIFLEIDGSYDAIAKIYETREEELKALEDKILKLMDRRKYLKEEIDDIKKARDWRKVTWKQEALCLKLLKEK